MDYFTCVCAARYGHIECLKYAHENGCPWNSQTGEYAAKNRQLECLKYACENGCPCSYLENDRYSRCSTYIRKHKTNRIIQMITQSKKTFMKTKNCLK
jgi:hypothetical protein